MPNTDLIDRAALGIGKAKREAFEKPEYADGWNSAIEIISNAPSVDAVPVVRCKECMKTTKFFSSECGDVIYCREHREFTDACGFCHLGERKEDDHAAD